MRLLADHIDNFFRHSHATQAEEIATGRANDDVGSGTAVTERHIVRNSVAEAYEREHHGDFDTDRDNAEQGTKWPVLQVLKDESVDQIPSLTAMLNLR